LDDKAKRRLSNGGKTSDELFALYYDRRKVKLTPPKNKKYKELLNKFHQFLGEFSALSVVVLVMLLLPTVAGCVVRAEVQLISLI